MDCCETRFVPDPMCTTWTSACASGSTTYPNACTLKDGPLCVCGPSSFNCDARNLCVQLECTTTSDCCVINNFVRPTYCDTYAANCQLDPTTYATECTTANGPTCNCNNNVSNYACIANQCVNATTCTTNSNCAYPNVCNPTTGRCVQCMVDTDCTATNAMCVANACVTPACITNADCSPFYACDATVKPAVCKKVGCTTDRECELALDSYIAFCDPNTSGDPPVRQCAMTCDRDTQCTATDPLGACVNGRCQPSGCESDEECKIRLQASHTRGTKALCQDKASSAADAGT
jgi:hypothetical protein